MRTKFLTNKKIYTVTIYFIFIGIISAQKNILASWRFDISDTTIKKTERRYWGLPRQIFETKKNDLILVSQQFMGWTIENIDRNTGNAIWKNSRNQDFPDNSQKMFIFDNIFEREDDNLEILGVKTHAKDIGPTQDGFPVRSIYNYKTGKELAFKEPKFDFFKDDYPMYAGGISRRFMREKNQYLVLNRIEYQSTNFALRSVDSNMVMKDTLGYIKSIYENKPDLKFRQGSAPLAIGNKIYLIHKYQANSSDTTLNKLLLLGITKQGTQLPNIDISKSLYYYLDNKEQIVTNDGFIITGMVDTTNTLKKTNRNIAMVAKIDTLGNKKWTVFLSHPEGDVFELVVISKDKKRGGYWACAGHTEKSNPFLYYISEDGKAKLIGKVFMPNNTEKFFPVNIWSLNDGSVILSYRYYKCDNDPQFIYCWGIAKIEKEDLEAVLTNNVDFFENNTIEIAVFPNPADENVNISWKEDNSGKIYLINQLGQVIISHSFTKEKNIRFDVRDIPKGVYFIKTDILGKYMGTKKVIIE